MFILSFIIWKEIRLFMVIYNSICKCYLLSSLQLICYQGRYDLHIRQLLSCVFMLKDRYHLLNKMELNTLIFPGSQRQIEAAIRQIGRKFPDVDLSPVNIPSGDNPQSAVLVPDIMQVMPGISQVTIISLASLSSYALSRCSAHVIPVFYK